MINIDEFVEMFDLKTLPGMVENHYQTLGGFMMAYLGRVPSTGDTLEIERLHLEIVDMDGMRVDKVIVTQLGPD
jgi:putative hemolysin